MFVFDVPSLRPGLRLDKHPVFCCLGTGVSFFLSWFELLMG
jgi:hypothetical protein